MKYVLGSSVALKWVLPESDTPKAVALRDDFRKGIHELLAPDIFAIEVAHALARAERRKIINPPEGTQKLIDVLGSLPTLHAYVPLLARAFEIASVARVGVYDCLYVALAEREGCDFITADDRLVKNLQTQFPFMTPLSSFP
ncbi:MAG TPA: type II toxin-antitoxin system VapC family toxin [Gemmataceae bacterium]|nr:type II toxin-antitoxin system VapC family toxin [Gemmataceae bacterium]